MILPQDFKLVKQHLIEQRWMFNKKNFFLTSIVTKWQLTKVQNRLNIAWGCPRGGMVKAAES